MTPDTAAQSAESVGAALGGLLFFTIIIGSVFGAICAYMASKRGRSSGFGFLGGFLFGVVGILYYLIAGDSTERRIMREEAARQQYRQNAVAEQPGD